jgi:cobalt-zinc-cadmium resistance protein CzcA
LQQIACHYDCTATAVVAGLLSRLLLGLFVNPVLYEMVAREGDVLQV